MDHYRDNHYLTPCKKICEVSAIKNTQLRAMIDVLLVLRVQQKDIVPFYWDTLYHHRAPHCTTTQVSTQHITTPHH